MNIQIPPIPPPPTNLNKQRKVWDNQNRIGLALIAITSIVLISINQQFRSYEADALRQRALDIGLLIPDRWNEAWEESPSMDPYYIKLKQYADQNNLKIMIGKLDFPYLAVELISWKTRIERFEYGLELKQKATDLGFTEFPNLHLPTTPQLDSVNSLKAWEDIIDECQQLEPKVNRLKKEAAKLQIQTKYWKPPYSIEKIQRWEEGITQTIYYKNHIKNYRLKAEKLNKKLPMLSPPYTKEIREEIHLLLRIWKEHSSLQKWAIENKIDIHQLQTTIQECQQKIRPCDPRWTEELLFTHQAKNLSYWTLRGVTNPKFSEHSFSLHQLDAQEVVYWFLMALRYQKQDLITNIPSKIESFSWNNQDQIKQLQLQRDNQTNNGPPKEYHHK